MRASAGQPQPGEPDAEERAAPLVDASGRPPRLPCASTASTTLAGGVARARERGRELAVGRLGRGRAARARAPPRSPRAAVLEAAQRVDGLVVAEHARARRRAPRAGQASARARSRARRPGSRSAPPPEFRAPRAHILAAARDRLPSRAGGPRRSLDSGRRGRRGAAARLPGRPRARAVSPFVRPARSTRRGRRSRPSGRRSSSSTCTSAASAADELLDELRGDGIPVVLVSGTVDVSRRTRAGRARCSPKPFDPAELVAAARRYARRLA